MNQTNPYLVPGAIVLAGALVAGVMLVSGGDRSGDTTRTGTNQQGQMAQQEQQERSLENLRPVDESDHIKGDPDAPIKIVEYSDFECPFCQRFHGTMNQVIEKYGESGEVAWVFRHFPIAQLHSKAPAVALASECVASLGGQEAFWQFTDRYFEVSPSNNRTDIETVIPQLVREAGVDEGVFQECFESDEFNDAVEADYNNAVATGGRGTPWSILVGPNGNTFPINGAQPLAAIEQLIEVARGE